MNSGSWSWNHHNSKDSAAREDRSAALPAGAQVGYCDDNDDDSWWCHQGMEVERPLPCHRQEDAAGAEPTQGELSLPPDSWDSSHPPKWRGQVSPNLVCHVVKSSYFSDQQIQADMNLRVTIIDEAHDNKIYNLTFPGSHTVVQVDWQQLPCKEKLMLL